MTFKRETLLLYGITDRSWLGGRSLDEQVEEALIGGTTMIQLREKSLAEDEFIAEARRIKSICARYNVPLIINDSVAVTLASGADGVHLGQSDTAIAEARALLGPGKIIGATAKTIEQAQSAEAQGADYLGCGAVFGSTTKLNAIPVTIEQLNTVAGSVGIPVVAIGGIDRNNISQLQRSRIAGVAVVSGIFASEDITRASQALLSEARIITGGHAE